MNNTARAANGLPPESSHSSAAGVGGGEQDENNVSEQTYAVCQTMIRAKGQTEQSKKWLVEISSAPPYHPTALSFWPWPSRVVHCCPLKLGGAKRHVVAKGRS